MASRGDWLLVQELLDRGDPEFVDRLRNFPTLTFSGHSPRAGTQIHRPPRGGCCLPIWNARSMRRGMSRSSKGCSSGPRPLKMIPRWRGSWLPLIGRSGESSDRGATVKHSGSTRE